MTRREGINSLQNQLHVNGGEIPRRSNESRETSEKEDFEVDLYSDSEEDRALGLELMVISRVVGPQMSRITIKDWISKHWGLRLIVKFIPRNVFIVVFEDGLERNKILLYDRPVWIRMYNLPFEYWEDKCLEKIGHSLGTLLEIDEDIIEKDSYVYVQMKIAALKEIPSQISLVTSEGIWLQHVEIEK
ncbi:hypothetical protein SUGI_0752610 [Cryptomeria japonica]|nr:hypothetical protein SUGI_0752610 [Cryptomeria japonica]